MSLKNTCPSLFCLFLNKSFYKSLKEMNKSLFKIDNTMQGRILISNILNVPSCNQSFPSVFVSTLSDCILSFHEKEIFKNFEVFLFSPVFYIMKEESLKTISTLMWKCEGFRYSLKSAGHNGTYSFSTCTR